MLRGLLLLMTMLAARLPAALGECTEADVKRMSHCMFSLQEPALTANKHERCQYGESYFRCFSGQCCSDPEFVEHVRFIQRDVKSWGCEGVYCGAAPRRAGGLPILSFLVTILAVAGLAVR